MKDSKNQKDLSLETVDLSVKGDKEPKNSSGSGSMPVLEAGSNFAGYNIIKKIAHGAMGVVYLAEDPRLKRKVAIKVILTAAGMQATEDQVNRFLREAQSIAKLRHKRIVPVYSVDTFENCQYFTMEYIDGPTLEQYLLKNEITAAKAIEIVLGIAEGLQEAHEKGVVHRDIKPANIMMQNGDSPMITDFGLAKILEHEQKLTMTGSMLGTPCYMSPEQARGDADLDYRSDIFSLGVVLYEMVTEKLPFKGESYMKTVLKVIDGDYIMPRKIKPRLSRDVESIIKKALEKDREFRYESMVDFIDDCTRFQKGEVVTISRSGIYRKIYRNIVKQRNSIIMTIFIALIIGYLMISNINQSQKVDDQIREKELASVEKQQASREKDKISKEKQQLEIQGELLKKGTTSPEFTERFDSEPYFSKNWFTSWQPVIVKKGTAEIPAGRNLLITPKSEGFSSSVIFSWKMKMPVGNKFIFFCGKPNSPDKSIEKPIFIAFQITRNLTSVDKTGERNADSQNRRKLRVSFYQSPNKAIPDRMNLVVNDFIGTQMPLAVKIYDLPDNTNESLNFSVKKHETFYEITIKEKEGVFNEKDKSFYEIFRVSLSTYLNPSPLQCGFVVPETNKFSMDLEKFRVDKWITGTSEIEINRIVESNWKNDYKLLFSTLQRHQDQLELALSVADTENSSEVANLKFQFAKTSFLMGIAIHRSLGYANQNINKEDLKLISDNYDKSLQYTQEYILAHEKSNKTEYINFEDLYVSVLVQIIYLNIYAGDFAKAAEFLKKYQEKTLDKTPYNNWLWNLPDPVEKLIAQTKAANKQKIFTNDLYPFLRQMTFVSEAGELSDIKRFHKDLLKNTLEVFDFELFEKYNSLFYDESNKVLLQDIIIKEIAKEIPKEKMNTILTLKAIKTIDKVFKTDEILAISNFKYEKWSMSYIEKDTNSWTEHWELLKSNPLTMRAMKAFPEFSSAMIQNADQGLEQVNGLIENENFRHRVIFTLLDDCINENRKAAKIEAQNLGEVFPQKIEQNGESNINVWLEEEGVKIRLIAKDNELKNKYSGNMAPQSDCWSLYFDFRQGQQFLSNQPGPGLFKICYIPLPNENVEARIYYEDNNLSPKFKTVNIKNTNGILQTNEVVLLLPFAEIYRITNGLNIKYFGFNATLHLETKERLNLHILFPNVNKKIFYLNKNAANVNAEPLLTDKDLINELTNVYQQYGDAYQDRLMIKKILDDWLNINSLKPLLNDSQIKKICDDYSAIMSDNNKKILVKKIIDDANLFFDVNGVLAGVSGQASWKEPFAKNTIEKVIGCLDQHLSLLEKRIKPPSALDGDPFFDEVKRARLLLKYADANGRKSYWRFLERLLNYFKENQVEAYENAKNFFVQMPDNDLNFREKAITYMLHGLVSESLYYSKKHLESELWKDDERVWFEYQLVSKIASPMGFDIRLSDEKLKEIGPYFSQQSKNMDVDSGLVLEKKMKLKEFMAKYPLAENPTNLLVALLADSNSAKKSEEVKGGYENVLKTATAPWITSLLKRRIVEFHK